MPHPCNPIDQSLVYKFFAYAGYSGEQQVKSGFVVAPRCDKYDFAETLFVTRKVALEAFKFDLIAFSYAVHVGMITA